MKSSHGLCKKAWKIDSLFVRKFRRGVFAQIVLQQLAYCQISCHQVDWGFVLDVKLHLGMDNFSVVWILFGTLSASGVQLAVSQYQIVSLQYMKIIHTTVPATRSSFIQNVMFARTLFKQVKMVSLNTGPILSGCRSIVLRMTMMVLLGVAVVNEWSQRISST